ncbi:DUF2252 family protein [Novosphingobium panipatense]|uniref:DUF2252 family protein n=1 Tax=Novosphingobium panipatense TaxID=428991 RepID=UPI0039A04358
MRASPLAGRVPEGPAVWICGDCHVGNLGPLANGDGEIEVQIRDLDQAVIGNPAHDLIRLGLSLATAAHGSDLPGVVTARYLAFVVGKAHGGQMDDATRTAWLAMLDTAQRCLSDTPSWLWESVVSLAGSHEAGYLDHCRRYALAA